MITKDTKPTAAESDPIHYYKGFWWFWNETWSDRLGPYFTRRAATNALHTYVEEVLGA